MAKEVTPIHQPKPSATPGSAGRAPFGLGVFALFFLASLISFAQSFPDSLSITTPKLSTSQASKLDSMLSTSKAARWRDSLSVAAWSSSLKQKIEGRFSTEKLTHLTDSLRVNGLPEPTIARHTDSLLRQKLSLLNEANQKQNELQKKVTARYEIWSASLRKQFNLDSAGVRLLGANTQGLPKTPNTSIPNLTGTNIPEVPAIPALASSDFPALGMSPELTSVGGSMAIPSPTQFAEWQQTIPAISNPGNMLNAQVGAIKGLTSDPGAAVEKAVTEVAEVNGAAKELQSADQLKSNDELLKTTEQLRDPTVAMEKGKQQAINHLAGHEGALNGAMAQMAKYKQRYSSIGSLSEIKRNDWLPKNGLKGKPFRERLRIGLNTGFKGIGDTLLLDFHPNASYRFTGRLEAGLGAIYRVKMNTKSFTFDQRDPVWGLSTFVVVKTFKSVFMRFEVDGNSFPRVASPDLSSYRDWKWSFLSGIQTNYKISKNWNGNVQMLYNFDSSLKDGFPEKLTLRFGVQYRLPDQKK